MEKTKPHICPVALAGPLASRCRRWVQNPAKILGPYLREGMTVLDFGCGPGFFTLEMARLVGPSGCVVACDLQSGMLDLIRRRLAGSGLESRVTLHQCQAERIGLALPLDFVLAFYILHELVNPRAFFQEIGALLKPGAQILAVEPPLHVSKKAFAAMLQTARDAGFSHDPPRVFLNKTVHLQKASP